MATDKEIIQQLVKIAKKQQLVINKLAQVSGTGNQPPPQKVEPAAPVLNKKKTLEDALPPALKPGGKIVQEVRVVEGLNEVHVRFMPGQDSDAAFKAVMATVQKALPGMTVKQV
jgi:hypothetical protein